MSAMNIMPRIFIIGYVVIVGFFLFCGFSLIVMAGLELWHGLWGSEQASV